MFDTNVIVSAALFVASVPAQALRLALAKGQIVLSLETLEEIGSVLRRTKFDRYVSVELREEFLRELVSRAVMVEVGERIDVCRDPKDNKFLELAVAGGVSHIVTGDNDLLVLHPFRRITICNPAALLSELVKA
ncbi:MAG TPA: putative toxin-antitoxin system toxin component, PIN family [Planctomycetota bacterium]|nr:putative toxin-antitoxin system toxin component, PIN family [Planctomycetota bacterium]